MLTHSTQAWSVDLWGTDVTRIIPDMHRGLESQTDSAIDAVVQLTDFQKAFNGVDVDLRGSPETRGELLLRCSELQDALWELCDQRMDDSQAKLSILK